MPDLQSQLSLLLADRHAPETRAFYEHLLGFIERRAAALRRACYADLLSPEEVEEVVAEVLRTLMTRAFAAFRGESMGELLAFVRTVTDRTLWHHARRRAQERRLMEGEGARAALDWAAAPAPDLEALEVVPEVPLSPRDQDFLVALLRAASKAEYARRHGVSRAAVTQRVQRVRERIAELAPPQRKAVDAWLHQAARGVLDEGP